MKPVAIIIGSAILLAILGWGGIQIFEYSKALNTYSVCNQGQFVTPCQELLGPPSRTHSTGTFQIQTWLKCEKFGGKDISVISLKNGKIKEIVNASNPEGKKFLKTEYNYDF